MTADSYVDRVLAEAELGTVCKTQGGDCESVAVAMSRCFDVDAFVAVYEPAENRRATHATVRIDGVLYDGDGRVSRDTLLERLELFSPRDFDGVDTREEMFDWFERKCVVELPPDATYLNPSPDVVTGCVDALETAQEQVERE